MFATLVQRNHRELMGYWSNGSAVDANDHLKILVTRSSSYWACLKILMLGLYVCRFVILILLSSI